MTLATLRRNYQKCSRWNQTRILSTVFFYSYATHILLTDDTVDASGFIGCLLLFTVEGWVVQILESLMRRQQRRSLLCWVRVVPPIVSLLHVFMAVVVVSYSYYDIFFEVASPLVAVLGVCIGYGALLLMPHWDRVITEIESMQRALPEGFQQTSMRAQGESGDEERSLSRIMSIANSFHHHWIRWIGPICLFIGFVYAYRMVQAESILDILPGAFLALVFILADGIFRLVGLRWFVRARSRIIMIQTALIFLEFSILVELCFTEEDSPVIMALLFVPIGVFLPLTAVALLQRSRRYVKDQEERTSLWQTIARNYDVDEDEALRVV